MGTKCELCAGLNVACLLADQTLLDRGWSEKKKISVGKSAMLMLEVRRMATLVGGDRSNSINQLLQLRDIEEYL